MIQEFEQVALAKDMPEYGLIAGDVGTVHHRGVSRIAPKLS